jgi:hypothetical protein
MGRKPSYLLSKIQADLCKKSARVDSAAAFGAVESSMTHIFGYDRAEAQVKAEDCSSAVSGTMIGSKVKIHCPSKEDIACVIDWPRGRIVFDRSRELFIIYADRKLLTPATIARNPVSFAAATHRDPKRLALSEHRDAERATQLYGRRRDEVSLDEIEKVRI